MLQQKYAMWSGLQFRECGCFDKKNILATQNGSECKELHGFLLDQLESKLNWIGIGGKFFYLK